jgi:hypothetical protein
MTHIERSVSVSVQQAPLYSTCAMKNRLCTTKEAVLNEVA